jgi:hypothetical protein
MLELSGIASAVHEFLDDPTDRRRFDTLFQHCFHITRGYLARLEAVGHRIGRESFAGNNPLDDCTFDCLATLFISKPGRPFCLITEYLHRHLSPTSSPEEVVARLKGLIAGHVRQELHKIRGASDPQRANIGRAVRRVLSTAEYEVTTISGVPHWAWTGRSDGLRPECPAVDQATLDAWVIRSVRTHPQMPERCRAVFGDLNTDDRFQNALEIYRLLSAIADWLTDSSDLRFGASESPRGAFIHRIIRRLAAEATRVTITEDLPRLSSNWNDNGAARAAYERALANLMLDFGETGDHDPLPQYLKAELDAQQDNYLTRHKYAWETVVAAAKDRLREALRETGLVTDREGRDK